MLPSSLAVNNNKKNPLFNQLDLTAGSEQVHPYCLENDIINEAIRSYNLRTGASLQ